jgi:transposase-like protein
MLDFRQSLINTALLKVLIRFHYPLEVMLTSVRWYVTYPLSLRNIEEMMQESAVSQHDVPEKIAIDKSGANMAAIESVKAEARVDILMRQKDT